MRMNHNPAEAALRRRAYELADSGRFESAIQIRQRLAGEGWPNVDPVIGGDYVMRSLSERINAARPH